MPSSCTTIKFIGSWHCTEKRVFASSKERKTAKTNRGIPQPLSSMPLQITGFEVRLIIADAPIA